MHKRITLSFIMVLISVVDVYSTTAGQELFQTTFVLKELPSNTPHDAALYLACDVVGWYPDVERLRFQKDSTGNYRLTLSHSASKLEYKVTRGSWASVEGRPNGRARPNRVIQLESPGKPEQVQIVVNSWEDLSKGSYNLYVYLLYLAVLQAILLIVAINTIRNKNIKANRVLSVMLLLIALALLGRASTYDRDIFNWAPKLLLIPEIILFTYAPLFYRYIHLLLKVPLPWKKYTWLQFVPAALQIIVYVPFLRLDSQTFIYRVMDEELFPIFAISGAVALLFNFGYWLASCRVIKAVKDRQKDQTDPNKYVRFLEVVLKIKASYLIVWSFISLVFFIGWITETNTRWLTNISIDALWVLFSMIIVCLAYYAMKQPEIFTWKKQDQRYRDNTMAADEFDKIKGRLSELMENEKVYVNPDLTLPQLSNQIPTTVHTLSRVINEGFNQTFSQFINEKRVKEFIHQIETDPKPDSFLSVAFRVGFNSKATFNRSFKKYTGTTPRLYFGAVQEPVAE